MYFQIDEVPCNGTSKSPCDESDKSWQSRHVLGPIEKQIINHYEGTSLNYELQAVN